jgi:hypothetical protein
MSSVPIIYLPYHKWLHEKELPHIAKHCAVWTRSLTRGLVKAGITVLNDFLLAQGCLQNSP